MLGKLGQLLRRVDVLLRMGLLLFVVGLAILVPTAAVTVEYTAQPEFCNGCHIMEPYYESWVNSSHENVSCIECHYEPGSLETVQGKFQALSQLAKYVTRTQGTKPWAEVSDQSCMRAGCHSVRKLEGEIAFGRIKFDHRHHLLESRRGRRLRCTSCHSQIVQGDHLTVTPSVCFMCHFMPVDGELADRTSDCLMCHGPPDQPVEVAGRDFHHDEYIERGVDCQECHTAAVEGDGLVRRERCHSCHGEIGHIERFEETAFLHEMHVTEHKVECFECHDEIYHGLKPVELPAPSSGEGCGACHGDSHDAAGLVYAGTGAVGVEDRPSRMHATRVVCDACHTGRSGWLDGNGGAHHGGHTSGHPGGTVAAAGAVDCIHCHGPEFDGMLEAWQGTVGEELERLGPLLAELEQELTEDTSDETRRLVEDARANLRLVQLDGSRGVHNIPYVLDVLRAAAEGTDRARVLVDPEAEPTAAAGLPFSSKHGCSECHLGLEREAPIEVHGRPFAHDRHLDAAALDCDACHSVEQHGAVAFPRADCASCHHEEREDSDFDPWDCSGCHGHQEEVVAGVVEGFAEVPGGMLDKACEDCHGEPPDVAAPNTSMCALCHDEEYPAKPAEWRAATVTLVGRLETALRAAQDRGADAASIEQATRALALVAADGSHGAHNFTFIERILSEALEALE